MYLADSIRALHDRYTSKIESNSGYQSSVILTLSRISLYICMCTLSKLNLDTVTRRRYHQLHSIILFTLISDIADNRTIKVAISDIQ